MKQDAPYPNNLMKLRKAANLSQAKIAKLWDCEPPLVSRIENGKVGITQEKMMRLYEAYGWSPSQIYGTEDEREHLTPVVGYVGAGVVFPYDDHAKGSGLESVPCPRGYENSDMVAVRVSGDSMRPMLRDGYLLFYSRKYDGVPTECLNQVCIVKRSDDGILVREIKSGSKPGVYHLIAYNGETEFDVRIEWAAKIIEYRPR